MGAKLIRFDVIPFPRLRVIGKSVVQKLNAGIDDRTIQDLWQSMADDGSLQFLLDLSNRSTHAADTVGWMGDFQAGDAQFTYLAGVWVHPALPVPEGYEYRDIVACEMAMGWVQSTDDPQGGDIMVMASELLTKAVQEHGYTYDGANGLFEIECYSYERF